MNLHPNRLEEARYWLLEELDVELGWTPLDYTKVPVIVIRDTHNCEYKYGMKGFLTKRDAIDVAVDIVNQDSFRKSIIRVVQVVQQNEVILVPKIDKRITECVVSNEQAANL